ncbi:Fc receptor-like protein 5 [Channa argus]|uniref:Fc receptor-like protein 5 n=1 Tax=Channa argus TaxID=215402 RepID=A0A6G1Q6N2_CHAAH|nr:Fc receptor-like protein 5 [Channa argus]
MKITLLLISLCVFYTLGSPEISREVSVRITPSRSQFFQYEDVSLSCESSAGVGQLRRNTTTRGTESCSYGWGSIRGSDCTINTVYPSDSGVYWCESHSGQQSQRVRVTVTAGSVILGSPPFPVMEGDDVTLQCKTRFIQVLSNPHTDFYKDGVLVRSTGTENMTIHSVSKSDEGLYRCSISGAGDSAESQLTVRESYPAVLGGPDTPAPNVPPLHRLICHVVVGTPYLVSTIILGLIYRDRRRALKALRAAREHLRGNWRRLGSVGGRRCNVQKT